MRHCWRHNNRAIITAVNKGRSTDLIPVSLQWQLMFMKGRGRQISCACAHCINTRQSIKRKLIVP